MKQISILGCGWLGLPLAKKLSKIGFSVKGSTTSLEKISVLEDAEIDAFQIEIGESQIKGEINSFLEKSEILIIDIPPKLRKETSENFVQKIQNLIPFIEKSSVEKVIFISSTSVYADDNSMITDTSQPNSHSKSGKQLAQTEHLLKGNSNFKTTVIRFGGLIGNDRHPIHFLSGRKNIENPDAPINLIQQADCIEIIEGIIKQEYWKETFNAVAPFHPTRKGYYTQKALELNLSLPEFDEEKPSFGKTIVSNRLENVLNFKFRAV
jgi:nucleoside-diphosphate-sugar epimerase